ncbi:MAG: XisH family protein [Lyngbya sp.]|nr:XisH family protein [Lyngbya sp.]
MSAKDRFHQVVKVALQKDCWQITHDPFPLQVDGITDMYIDLGAEKIIAAEKDHQKIAVEVKSFLGSSSIYEFHLALGQYTNYRYALEAQEPERILYLAITSNIYNNFFQRPFIQSVIRRSRVNLMIYNLEREEIIQWQT